VGENPSNKFSNKIKNKEMTTHYSQRTYSPSAFITKGKQRLKQYENSVYLRDGEEFELELFNPTTEKILAKIKIDGNYISSAGIVLRPGERVFLERYLDDPRKFKFDTYFIDSKNSDAVNATRNNGLVEIEFYKKYIYSNVCWNSVTYYSPSVGTAVPGTLYSNTTGCIGSQGPSGPKGNTTNTSKNIHFSTTDNTADITEDPAFCYGYFSQELETGRVEKGNYSDQNFESVHDDFNFSYSWKTVWKILPESRKPIMSEDLKVFCGVCGAKRKKSSHNFCPHCGSKY